MRNFFERFTANGDSPEREEHVALTASDRDAIRLRADIRRRSQELNVQALGVELPGSTDAMRAVYDATLAWIHREASGSGAKETGDVTVLMEEATKNADLFPMLAAYCAARAAKARCDIGGDATKDLEIARRFLDTEKNRKTSPANLMPDALILGVQTRIAAGRSLPSREAVATGGAADKQLLADYALVLEEKDREAFLNQLPESARRSVSALLDASVATVLHQSLITKGESGKPSAEEQQYREVRRRLFAELKETARQKNPDDHRMARLLAEAMVDLGEGTRQLLLEIIRDEAEQFGTSTETKPDSGHLPRIIRVFMDQFDDWKGNDVILQLAGDRRLSHRLAVYLFLKLVEKGYISKDVGEWWSGKNSNAKSADREKKESDVRKTRQLEVLQRTVADLGVVPSRDILEFIDDDKQWKRTPEIANRIAEIRAKKEAFDSFTDAPALVSHLHGDSHAAMIYYLLHAGNDRFNLINNYSFSQFKEILGLVADLRVHEKPLKMFDTALKKGDMGKKGCDETVERLRAGHFPLSNVEQAYHEVSFDVSENAAIKNANMEIGRVLGKNELGVAILFPMYRELLSADPSSIAQSLLQRMETAKTFADRRVLIDDIDRQYSDFRDRTQKALADNWKILGEKMLLEATIENVLSQENVVIRGEELLPRLDTKRLDWKRMNKNLLVALHGGNERATRVATEISRKKKALGNLREGLARAKGVGATKLTQQIVEIESDIAELERERAMVANMKVGERFAHLSPDERKAKIEKLGNEIIALTEKSPSAIFTSITMQVLGDERLLESDRDIIKELESHLQGPFQTIQDTMTYQKPVSRGETKKRQRVGLRWVDKTRDLMHMARFADSKICCFSSNNYEMKVQHEMANKFWVASVTADPLSFVISMELPESTQVGSDHASQRENLGFIFGSFAVNEDEKPAVLLNGIYYAPGIENEKQVAAILAGVERMFEGLPIATLATASQHGGSINFPEGWTNDAVTLTRLRALDDGSGNPETKIYDDCGTGSNLNQPHQYGGHVYHKQLKKP